jgi:amino acid transporter
MGTWPVFMTAISTILGAILFLRFGYALGHVGLIGALGIIVIGHLVTVPTALAVAEIATNQKVEGGGAYYMISRSFGLNIGAAIGIALFLSQAISVAFYVIAFAVAFDPLALFIQDTYGIYISERSTGLIFMALLTALMLTKGANIGVKALYLVVVILAVSLLMFFFGSSYSDHASSPFTTIENPDSFFYVFTIIFPAFTGIAAGLGLSGDLKDPKRSIPKGTIWATVGGIVVYIVVSFKLFFSASPEDLANTDHLIMGKIAVWGPIIPIGLAAAAISSALGSIMIAPRTLQALGVDKIFPGTLNNFFAKGKTKDNEPVNASIITCVIAFFFVAIGDIDFVAQIISMFFMVTYGAICLISFLEHFAADPSYRPSFRSRWWVSLFGSLLCFYLMFKMNFTYALLSILIMGGIYFWVSRIAQDRAGLADLFKGVIFQVNRELQVFLQKRDRENEDERWRPFIICISEDTFQRTSAFDLVRWLSYRYGFGTYIHYIEGFLSKDTYQLSLDVKRRLVALMHDSKSKVYLDTIISPSMTSAIAQSIQLSGLSGKGNNLILFEFAKGDAKGVDELKKNFKLLMSTDFDVCLLRSDYKNFGYHEEIHIWISSRDYENSSLMILLAYILLGHPEWKEGFIKIFSIYEEGEQESQRLRLKEMIEEGRLPISQKNIQLIHRPESEKISSVINRNSRDADFTIMGFSGATLDENSADILEDYPDLANVLFVSAYKEKVIR